MNEKEVLPATEKNEIIVYQPEGGEFHINEENELNLESTCRKFRRVQIKG